MRFLFLVAGMLFILVHMLSFRLALLKGLLMALDCFGAMVPEHELFGEFYFGSFIHGY